MCFITVGLKLHPQSKMTGCDCYSLRTRKCILLFSPLLHDSYNQNCRWYGKDIFFTDGKGILNIKSEDNSFTKIKNVLYCTQKEKQVGEFLLVDRFEH